ncbi:uncharacterized protein TNCV_2751041 [Trichonephila clavipes]|uniref:Uncharacterized protein n=1 Tax=Trichonephila clavipes TaxID=2585209 RepID=A0A8X6WJ50_TRICX|nr:uncharacterized protein TNCV_2751041 [Trichonephila clavipes]
MGKCRSYRPRKRKFHGNQNTSTETATSNEEIMTASSLKLQQCNEVNNDVSNISEHLTGNRLIDLEILIGIFSLLCCPTKMCTAGSLYLAEDSRLQNYYEIAIPNNIGNLDKMQSAVIAAFFHCCSSKHQPKHGQCPVGDKS